MLTILPLPIFLCFPFNKTLPDIITFEDSLPVLRIKEIKGRHFLDLMYSTIKITTTKKKKEKYAYN